MDLLPAGWRTSQLRAPLRNSLSLIIKLVDNVQVYKNLDADGQYLASGGEDGVVCIWRVTSADASYKDLMVEGNSGIKVKGGKSAFGGIKTSHASILIPDKVFHIEESPLQEFYGHSSDVLDLSWSNSNCLLSSSMDKTVRLWQVGCDQCLNVFHHNDYAAATGDQIEVDDAAVKFRNLRTRFPSPMMNQMAVLILMMLRGLTHPLKQHEVRKMVKRLDLCLVCLVAWLKLELDWKILLKSGDLFCLAGSFIFAVQQMDWVRSGFFGRKKCWILIFTRNFLRRELWKNLECFRNSVGQSPWLIVGDFNVVKSPCEKLGGNVSGYENDFLQCLNSLEIDDYPAGIEQGRCKSLGEEHYLVFSSVRGLGRFVMGRMKWTGLRNAVERSQALAFRLLIPQRIIWFVVEVRGEMMQMPCLMNWKEKNYLARKCVDSDAVDNVQVYNNLDVGKRKFKSWLKHFVKKRKGRGDTFVTASIMHQCLNWSYDGTGKHLELDAKIHIQGRRKTSANKITGIQFSQEISQGVMITSKGLQSSCI
uniref:Uncharacterized protein n=1 Tax=Fagus sylvatica TaxID=28930 RepID=A0A2N9HVI1_FAGSY